MGVTLTQPGYKLSPKGISLELRKHFLMHLTASPARKSRDKDD